MNNFTQVSKDYYRIEKAIHFLEEYFGRQPDLKEMAQAAGLSEYHFQKIFQRWAGISPKRFMQFLTKESAKALLKKSSVLDTSLAVGLSGPSRLHDLFVNCEAMSPGEYKLRGEGLIMEYGFCPSPFGECLIAWTERGICHLAFIGNQKRKNIFKIFGEEWKNARLVSNPQQAGKYSKKIFSLKLSTARKSINVLCRGTNFQIKVWEALLKIPYGTAVTYQTIAKQIGCPKAMRAVGSAIAKNSIAYLIPCHRVIRSLGALGGYRWGITRKRVMLALESSVRKSYFS